MELNTAICQRCSKNNWQRNNDFYCREKNGSLSGPYEVTATELNTVVMLKTQPSIEILTASGMERTHFAFGTTDKWSVYARVTGIRPRSNQVEITAVIEDNRVHQN